MRLNWCEEDDKTERKWQINYVIRRHLQWIFNLYHQFRLFGVCVCVCCFFQHWPLFNQRKRGRKEDVSRAINIRVVLRCWWWWSRQPINGNNNKFHIFRSFWSNTFCFVFGWVNVTQNPPASHMEREAVMVHIHVV